MKNLKILFLVFLITLKFTAQTVTIDPSSVGRMQVIDGFGTCLSGTDGEKSWFQNLYYDDAWCSLLRIDLTPSFVAPYSDYTFNSPWFHNNPALPGAENNNVRTYTNASDYTRMFGGKKAQIAIMGSSITQNILKFDYTQDGPRVQGAAAKAGLARISNLGDFKLTASIWSPAPWLKISSGNTYGTSSGIMPSQGTAWPFIWGGNFAGGKLDVSGIPLPEFFDGTQNTSALTQYARTTAAYIKGFQDKFGVSFYSISIQNELNFEEFYNSCYFPLSSQYITALKTLRTEFDNYQDLKNIKIIMGPEDLLGGDSYGLWQYGGGATAVHKNLQYLSEIDKDPVATSAINYYCIHGYSSDGVTSAGTNPSAWDRWASGWTTSPAAGIPANIKGFKGYNKKSWMTETSGENIAWLNPSSGFPNNGGFSIALKIHQALTNGYESAWEYWQMSDGKTVAEQTLTDQTQAANSPKYNAFKHFSRYIRPNSIRLNTTVTNGTNINVSSYIHDADQSLCVVIVNSNSTSQNVTITIPTLNFSINSFDAYTSGNNSYWVKSSLIVNQNKVIITVPGYGVSTLYGKSLATGNLELGRNNLLKIYPNPSSHSIDMNYNLTKDSHVEIFVYDELGKKVMQILKEEQFFGEHQKTINVDQLKNGVYFVKIIVNEKQQIQKLIVNNFNE